MSEEQVEQLAELLDLVPGSTPELHTSCSPE